MEADGRPVKGSALTSRAEHKKLERRRLSHPTTPQGFRILARQRPALLARVKVVFLRDNQEYNANWRKFPHGLPWFLGRIYSEFTPVTRERRSKTY